MFRVRRGMLVVTFDRVLHGSLCSGYGGLDLAASAVFGGEVAWVADNDPDASAVLSERFAGVRNVGDIRLVDWSSVPRPDVLTASYPCQPYSDAGLRRGQLDERDVWPAVAEAIRQLRPGIVILENVRGHLSRGWPRVAADLAELGFDCRWSVFRASEVGACHERARLFALAYADRIGRESWTRLPAIERGTEPGRVVDHRSHSSGLRPSGSCDVRWGPYEAAVRRHSDVVGRLPPAPLVGSRLSADFVEWLMMLPAGFVSDVLPRRPAVRVLGNGVVPLCAELAIRTLLGPQ